MLIKKLVEEYGNKYHGKTYVCHTNYKPVEKITIKFDNKQLPHLLGLHKIYKDNPSKIILRVLNDDITYEKIKRHKDFGNIKDRLNCCLFLDNIFSTNCQIIYISEVDKQNSMRLDIAFYESLTGKKYVLGLRCISVNEYVPITFYSVRKSKQEFLNSKRVKVNQIIIH